MRAESFWAEAFVECVWVSYKVVVAGACVVGYEVIARGVFSAWVGVALVDVCLAVVASVPGVASALVFVVWDGGVDGAVGACSVNARVGIALFLAWVSRVPILALARVGECFSNVISVLCALVSRIPVAGVCWTCCIANATTKSVS